MSRYLGEDARYAADSDALIRPELTPAEISQLSGLLSAAPLGQVSPDQITANQNNYPLPEEFLIRLSSDAARTITGFAGARPELTIICNVGAQNIILAHQNAGSTASNRIISPTGADYTLNANESAHVVYDFTSLRWRITAGTGA